MNKIKYAIKIIVSEVEKNIDKDWFMPKLIVLIWIFKHFLMIIR